MKAMNISTEATNRIAAWRAPCILKSFWRALSIHIQISADLFNATSPALMHADQYHCCGATDKIFHWPTFDTMREFNTKKKFTYSWIAKLTIFVDSDDNEDEKKMGTGRNKAMQKATTRDLNVFFFSFSHAALRCGNAFDDWWHSSRLEFRILNRFIAQFNSWKKKCSRLQ